MKAFTVNMDKSTILRTFLSYGAQVDADALQLLSDNPTVLDTILSLGKEKLPPVITQDFIKSFIEPKKTIVSVNQLSEVLSHRYEVITNLLIEKEDLKNLVSINKITEKLKNFSVIGAVVENNGESVILEDKTGSVNFKISSNLSKFLVEDDIIGVVCEYSGTIPNIIDVVYPDIPLKKDFTTINEEKNYIFLSDLHIDSPQFNENRYKKLIEIINEQKNAEIFVLGGMSESVDDANKLLSDIKHRIHLLSNASQTSKMDNILVFQTRGDFLTKYSDIWKTSPETAVVNLVKKRNLNPILTSTSYNNSFLLENVPDIISIGGSTPFATNYKGTTIISTGNLNKNPIFWNINLKTRETFKIDLS